jgi:hypothetical protein
MRQRRKTMFVAIAIGLAFAGCQDKRQEQEAKEGAGKTVVSSAKPLQEPCANGRLISKNSYSECIANTWHNVEDDIYDCPPLTTFRVADDDTKQPCGNGQQPPALIGTRFKNLHGDTSCQDPQKIADQVLWRCTNGVWEYAKVLVYRCRDGRTGIIDQPTWIPTSDRCELGGKPPFDRAR